MVSLKWRIEGKGSVFRNQFSEQSADLASGLRDSRSRTHEAAAWFDGGAALEAQRTILWLVTRNRQIEQRLALNREFNLAAAAVDQGSGGDDAPSGFLDDLDGLQRGAAGGPDIFDDQDMLVGLDGKAPSQGHGAAGVAFCENRRHSSARGALRFRQGACNFLAYNYSPERRRNDRCNEGIGEQGR